MKKFLVGGAVRDRLMGRTPKDMDFLIVGATAQDIRDMLDQGFTNVGESFPVFLHPKTGDEYALARREKKTGKGYTGFTVEFDADVTLEEDLSRRDLTINAMAVDQEVGALIDPFGGSQDLDNKILRHVGNAFVEDPLRVVRLARFFARYTDFKVARGTAELCVDIVNSGEMDELADERFWAEMEKVMEQGGDPIRFFRFLRSVGALHKVKFFAEVFGDIRLMAFNGDWPAFLEKCVMLPSEDRLPMFVSLVAANLGASSQIAGAKVPERVKRLTSNLKKVRSWTNGVTPEQVTELISKNRGWDPEPKVFADVVLAMTVAEVAGEKFAVPAMVIAHAADLGRQMKADKFLHLPGKLIGEAMAKERLDRVAAVMRGDM